MRDASKSLLAKNKLMWQRKKRATTWVGRIGKIIEVVALKINLSEHRTLSIFNPILSEREVQKEIQFNAPPLKGRTRAKCE